MSFVELGHLCGNRIIGRPRWVAAHSSPRSITSDFNPV
jgi:hypothetical protein